MRKVVLKKDTPVSLTFKGNEVLQVMVHVDRYGEPTLMFDMLVRGVECNYDWSTDASIAINRAVHPPRSSEAEEEEKPIDVL